MCITNETRRLVVAALLALSASAWAAEDVPAYLFSTRQQLRIDGENPDGTRLSGFTMTRADEDFDASTLDNVLQALVTHGSSLVSANSRATMKDVVRAGATSFEPAPSLSASVFGIGHITRSPNTSDFTSFVGGFLEFSANSRASYKDTLTFVTPNRPNPLAIDGYLLLSGSLQASASYSGSLFQGQVFSIVEVSSNMFPTYHEELRFNSNVDPTSNGDQAQGLKRPLRFRLVTNPESPTLMEMSLFTQGGASINGGRAGFSGAADPGKGEALFSSHFFNTLTWGGITSVTDANTGAEITDWSVTSASGFDYTKSFELPAPVPLPAAWINLLAGLSCAGWLSRRRRTVH